MTRSLPPRVIVVDDEEIIASTTALILNQQGFEAVGFRDPLLALKNAKSEGLDVLICDLLMPEMSGVHLAIEIQDIHPKSKVLLISGLAPTADLIAEARAQGLPLSHFDEARAPDGSRCIDSAGDVLRPFRHTYVPRAHSNHKQRQFLKIASQS